MDTDTQPVHISVIRQINQAEGLAPQPPATLINSLVFARLPKKIFFSQGKIRSIRKPLVPIEQKSCFQISRTDVSFLWLCDD